MKERGYWQRIWLANPDLPEIHVFPHWNWGASNPGGPPLLHHAACAGLCQQTQPGQPLNVTVYAIANVPGGMVELELNGKTVGSSSINFGGWATWASLKASHSGSFA